MKNYDWISATVRTTVYGFAVDLNTSEKPTLIAPEYIAKFTNKGEMSWAVTDDDDYRDISADQVPDAVRIKAFNAMINAKSRINEVFESCVRYFTAPGFIYTEVSKIPDAPTS
jgi:hypothetical protein